MPLSRRSRRSRTKTQSQRPPEQLSLPLELPLSTPASRSRNPSRWIDRPAPSQPSRPASKPAKRVQTYSAPVSSFLDSIKEKVAQSHPLWLTSPLSSIIADVIQNGWGTAMTQHFLLSSAART